MRGIPGGIFCLHFDPWLPFVPWSPAGPNRALSVGDQVACAIRPDDTLDCYSEDPAAALPPPAGTFKAVSVGTRFACAIRTDDSVACWGDNTWGQLDVP
jgi:alpha-tubulin suppressor-like RCC1 family protein